MIQLDIEFLGDAEAWTGSGEGCNAIGDLFHEDAEAVFPDIGRPEPAQKEELVGLAAPALAQRMEALPRWIDPGAGPDVGALESGGLPITGSLAVAGI